MELGDSLYGDSGYAFSNPRRQALDPLILTDTWRRLAAKAGLPKVRLCDLRHFRASVLLQANTNPTIVQERLGHATIAVTMDIYSHSIPSLRREATQDLAKAMRASESGG